MNLKKAKRIRQQIRAIGFDTSEAAYTTLRGNPHTVMLTGTCGRGVYHRMKKVCA